MNHTRDSILVRIFFCFSNLESASLNLIHKRDSIDSIDQVHSSKFFEFLSRPPQILPCFLTRVLSSTNHAFSKIRKKIVRESKSLFDDPAVSRSKSHNFPSKRIFFIMLRTGLQAGLKAVSRKSNNVGALRHMSKEIKFGVEGRNAMLEGVNTLADAVQVRRKRSISKGNSCRVTPFIRHESRMPKFHFCDANYRQNGIQKMRSQKIGEKLAVDFGFFYKHGFRLQAFSILALSNAPLSNFLLLNKLKGYPRTQGTKLYYCSTIWPT